VCIAPACTHESTYVSLQAQTCVCARPNHARSFAATSVLASINRPPLYVRTFVYAPSTSTHAPHGGRRGYQTPTHLVNRLHHHSERRFLLQRRDHGDKRRASIDSESLIRFTGRRLRRSITWRRSCVEGRRREWANACDQAMLEDSMLCGERDFEPPLRGQTSERSSCRTGREC
jgi:hypothetical protein